MGIRTEICRREFFLKRGILSVMFFRQVDGLRFVRHRLSASKKEEPVELFFFFKYRKEELKKEILLQRETSKIMK